MIYLIRHFIFKKNKANSVVDSTSNDCTVLVPMLMKEWELLKECFCALSRVSSASNIDVWILPLVNTEYVVILAAIQFFLQGP